MMSGYVVIDPNPIILTPFYYFNRFFPTFQGTKLYFFPLLKHVQSQTLFHLLSLSPNLSLQMHPYWSDTVGEV